MFEIFDRVYCIHLPNATRRSQMESEFARVGIRDARYVAASAPPHSFTVPNMRRNPRAEFGVNLSHLTAVVQALTDRAERPLFVEDDVVFRQMPECDLPDWDLLYLGGHPREPVERASANVVRVKKFSCAEAYSVRGSLLRDLHQFWCDRITKPNAMYDFILGEFAAAHRAYCFYPVVTEQRLDVSHVSGNVDDKRELIRRGWASNLSSIR